MKFVSMFKCGLLALLLGTFFLNGCLATRSTVDQTPVAEVDVAQPPPLPVMENITLAPGPGFVWVPGAWSWRRQWVWDRGHWAHPPQVGAVWISPRYEKRGNKHVFIAGGWKVDVGDLGKEK